MDDMVALRCKYCGAPLDEGQVRSNSQYVTCQSCGTTQQRMDAQAYLEQLMGQVKSWISSSIPMGFNIAGAENVDPVARHSIFVKDVKPKIELEMNEFRFSNISLLGNCLLALPSSTLNIARPAHTASKAFEFNAKVKSVSALAVDDEGKGLIEDAASLSLSYAMMINNVELLSDNKEGRYILMSNNFAESANALKKAKGKELVTARFEALATICRGIDELLSGNLVDGESMIRNGRDQLAPIKDQAFSSMEYGIMVQGISQELSVCDVLLSVIEATKTSDGDPLASLDAYVRALNVKLPSNPGWGFLLNDNSRMTEVMDNMSKAMSARSGKSTIPVAAGDGKLLVPFWEVNLRYSFETGALWKKKSVEVEDKLLLMADFVTDGNCLNNPSIAVTDIFNERPDNGRFAGLKGCETSISNGSGLRAITDSVSEKTVGGREIVMPMSTRKEAEKFCNDYLEKLSAREKKFKLSRPEIKRLIYIPCKDLGSAISCDSLANMTPVCFTRMDPSKLIRK